MINTFRSILWWQHLPWRFLWLENSVSWWMPSSLSKDPMTMPNSFKAKLLFMEKRLLYRFAFPVCSIHFLGSWDSIHKGVPAQIHDQCIPSSPLSSMVLDQQAKRVYRRSQGWYSFDTRWWLPYRLRGARSCQSTFSFLESWTHLVCSSSQSEEPLWELLECIQQ